MDFKFSVIIPLYNTELYLEEAIDSIINQDIGFEENIEIILINDGSTDRCEEICLSYQKKYPQNITYKYKENGGASSACNFGLPLAKGKYVNMFGSDDIWELNVFSLVYDFFEKNYDDIDMVACRFRFFGTVNGYTHALDYKFTGDYIVDLLEDHKKLTVSLGNCFLKRESIIGRTLDERLVAYEDSNFVAELLLEKCRYGVMRSALCHYRRRDDGSSLINTCSYDKTWYTDVPVFCWQHLIDLSIEKYGKVLKFIQYTIGYALQWRVRGAVIEQVLTKEEIEEYTQLVSSVLQNVSDRTIFQLRNIDFVDKNFLIDIKYGKHVISMSKFEGNNLYFKKVRVFNFDKNVRFHIYIMNRVDNNLVIEGLTDLFFVDSECELYAKADDNSKYYAETLDYHHYKRRSFRDVDLVKFRRFKIVIPLEKETTVCFYTKYKKKEILLRPEYAKFSRILEAYNLSYSVFGNKIIRKSGKGLKIQNYSTIKHLKFEAKYCNFLWKKKERELVKYRFLYHINRIFQRKEIWLITDKTFQAGDNGEYVFKWLSENKHKSVAPYFIIDKSASDFERLSGMGKILSPESKEHKLKFLLSSKIISAYGDEAIINAFGNNRKYLWDLFTFDYVYLNHGIMQGDLSSWLHKFNKNIKLFITCGKDEYASLLNNNYYYDESVVKRTGFPRFDGLVKELTPVKKIIIMPTWRENIAGKMIVGKREREYVPDFKETEYYMFYQSLINNERLISSMKELGYSGEFFLHGSFVKQYEDFSGNETIKISEKYFNYEPQFINSSLMVTDYSSVQFDYAYMNKPVIYCQYDKNVFEENHTWGSIYFDYEKDGFGPICSTLDSTVDAIISHMKNDCAFDEKYKERVKNYFDNTDRNNSERVVKAINELGKR